MSDPIFPDASPVPAAPSHEHHEKRPESEKDWVVIHRGKEGSKAHVDSLRHKLIKAHINARVEHDDEHRVVLEVAREDEKAAIEVIGDANVSGQGENAHRTREERMEESEQAELHGPFKAATTKWVLVVVAIAVLFFLALWIYPIFFR
jgi:hypothetical protein